MSATLTLQSHDEVYQWLRQQSEKLGLTVALLTDEARMEGGWLYLPVYIENVVDAYDNALKLQKLEDTWNDRELKPALPIFLVPAKNPLRQAVRERIEGALQRKLKAVEAFGKAANQQEQESAAAEFREAEQAETAAHKAYEQIMPWSERVS